MNKLKDIFEWNGHWKINILDGGTPLSPSYVFSCYYLFNVDKEVRSYAINKQNTTFLAEFLFLDEDALFKYMYSYITSSLFNWSEDIAMDNELKQ